MAPFNALAKVTILMCFSVHGSFSACSNEHNGFVEGFLGRNVTLSCMAPFSCDTIYWKNHTGAFVSPFDTSHTSIYRTGLTSFLRIYEMILDDAGPYSCWCYKDHTWVGDGPFCSVNLSAICQTTVRLHRVNILYNGSNIYPSSPQAVSVTAEDTIKVNCSEGATPVTNCRRVTEQGSSGLFTYKFKVLPKHHLCYIACTERGQIGNVCTVNITLHVSLRETTTPFSLLATIPSTTSTKFVEKAVHTSYFPHGVAPSLVFTTFRNEDYMVVTDKPGTFPVITFVGVLTFILVAVTFVVSFYLLFSRSKLNVRSKKTTNPVNSQTDARILTGPTYANVDEFPDAFKKEEGGSLSVETMERGAPNVDDFYFEVTSSEKEEPTSKQAKKDYYASVLYVQCNH